MYNLEISTRRLAGPFGEYWDSFTFYAPSSSIHGFTQRPISRDRVTAKSGAVSASNSRI